MSDAVPKFERLMNLVAFLLASPEPVPFSTIRKTVVGYNDFAREDAVEKRFDRDKKELREIGIPVEYTPSDERGRDGYYISRDEYFHHELALSPEEATLMVVLANAARIGNDAINANLRSALLKMSIDSPLQEDVQAAVANSSMHAFSRGKRDRAVLDNLDTLVDSVAQRKTVRFVYRAANSRKTTKRAVNPYGLGYNAGEWYVVGHDVDKDALRQFKVIRITGKVSSKRSRGRDFEVPNGFDIEQHIEHVPWEYAKGKEESAEILFHSDVAWMVEDKLKPGQEFVRRKDGAGVLRLKVRKSLDTHKRLLSGLLASYSGQCAVLKPKWLRQQAIDHLTTMRKRYD